MTFRPVAEHLRKIASWTLPGLTFQSGAENIKKDSLLEPSWSDLRPLAENLKKQCPGAFLEWLFSLWLKILKNIILEPFWNDFSACGWKSYKILSSTRTKKLVQGFQEPVFKQFQGQTKNTLQEGSRGVLSSIFRFQKAVRRLFSSIYRRGISSNSSIKLDTVYCAWVTRVLD